MKLSFLAVLSISLLSVSAFAQDDYVKFEKAVTKASIEAVNALKTKDTKKISAAHYKLAAAQAEARAKGHTCDIGYLSDIVGNMQVAVDNSAWFQKTLPTLPIYQQLSKESLQLQLAAAGLVKNKTMTRDAFVKALQNIVNTSDVTLYKPQPGVLHLGDIQFASGMAIETSLYFDDETGEVKTDVAAPVAADIQVIKNKITIMMNGAARFNVEVERNDKPVTKDVKSSDSILIKGIGADDDFMGQLFLTPDECSA
ncbi:MAG: hypothetical protein H0V66_02015 [Bdellovibrionales bacterium]|nr:hypothetical protein [Bdellovibrionales bacterium]